MYCVFKYKNGSNPYITFNNAALFRMLKKYDCEQTGETSFFVLGESQWLSVKPGKSQYEINKEIVRTLAQEWQYNFYRFNYSYEELANWQAFFTELGARFGLLTEFKENAII